MKKTGLIALAILLTLTASAQSENGDLNAQQNHLSVSGGPVSAMYFGVGWIFDFVNAFVDRQDNTTHYGNYAINYHRQLKDWLRVGVKADWEGAGYRFYTDDTKSEAQGMHTMHWVSAMASCQFTYLHHPHVMLYSGVDLGVGALLMDDRYYDGYTNADGQRHTLECEVIPAINITAIGLNAGGKHVYGLVELNIGFDALVKVGIGTAF